MVSIHFSLDRIKAVAQQYANEHNCNYTVIIMNQSKDGKFDINGGSTYEFVRDSFFEKKRDNIKVIEVIEPEKSTKEDVNYVDLPYIATPRNCKFD